MIFDERALELMVARAARAAVTEALVPVLEREAIDLTELVSVAEVARILDCSTDHVTTLIDEGSLGEAFDVRSAGSSRAVRRVARSAVAAYLDRSRIHRSPHADAGTPSAPRPSGQTMPGTSAPGFSRP